MFERLDIVGKRFSGVPSSKVLKLDGQRPTTREYTAKLWLEPRSSVKHAHQGWDQLKWKDMVSLDMALQESSKKSLVTRRYL